MEGGCQNDEVIQKKKARTKGAPCDIGCQTDTIQQPPTSSSPNYEDQGPQEMAPSGAGSCSSSSSTPPLNLQGDYASSEGGAGSTAGWDKRSGSGSSSASASGASTPGIDVVASGIATSAAQAQNLQQTIDAARKLAGPAGVKPMDIASYFGDKNPQAVILPTPQPVSTLAGGQNAAQQGQQPQAQPQQPQQQKSRAPSTTGAAEAKKQVRNNPPATNGSTAPAAPAQAASSSTANNNSNANGKSEGPSWNDDNCKLRLVINRFSHLEETMCSPPKSIEGVSWKIMVMPKQHMVQKKQQKCMGFFLQCAPERAYSDQWSVHAVADMRMISYKPNVPHFARRTTHTYTSKENDWGYSCFMTWADIIDEGQGYIRDDTVVLEIAVKAEPPKNMMTHEDFLDKIEKWIVLADMQMKKGNIDLALEANQSAMKFCKGKDDVCYQRLETQRETFVNAKLFESIERIEKGPVVCTDTTHGKPTSLRQALTGAQKSLNGKMTAKGAKKARAVVTVQHMKKKKPYDQNNTNAQKTNSGGPTVKDLVEKRKKSDDATKKDLKSKEELEQEIDEQTDSEESRDEKATASGDEEDDAEFDDEEYCEGDYPEQADECSTLGRAGSRQYDENEEYASQWEEDYDDGTPTLAVTVEGVNEDGIVVFDRESQTDRIPEFSGSIKLAPLEPAQAPPPPRQLARQVRHLQQFPRPQNPAEAYQNELLAETIVRRFQGDDESSSIIHLDQYQQKMGFPAKPEDSVEKIFGGTTPDLEESVAESIISCLPEVMANGACKDGQPTSMTTMCMAEKMIKSWLDVEGTILGNMIPGGVLERLSENDRRDLVDELSFKMQPLVSTLDMEFRETVHLARSFLINTRNALEDSNKMTADVDAIRNPFIERLACNMEETKTLCRDMHAKAALLNDGNLDVIRKGSGKKQIADHVIPPPAKPAAAATSAPATSATPVKGAAAHGRPTVIAKRSMKPPASEHEEINRGHMNEFFRAVDLPAQEEGYNMRDVHVAFRRLNATMMPMIGQISANNRRVISVLSEVLGENGNVNQHLRDVTHAHLQANEEVMTEFYLLCECSKKLNEEHEKALLNATESAKAVSSEVERHAKTMKELKDVKNQLKKAESKATKEENRATGLQVQLNELDEKSKLLRKELETLKKKSAEERAKAKKEKERDTQTIRQQSIEVSERENERDKAKKEVEEAKRQKDNAEKEKKAVATQLQTMLERARAGEVAALEARCSAALEEIKKRKEAVQNGYAETETLANRVRQGSDRDIMRKSLAEWKAALDKCDAQSKSVKSDYDHAIEQIKSGSKTLAQTIEIKLPAADALPKLVKPPPVQVVAPSASVVPPPIIPPTPAAGVIGQQRQTPIGRPAESSPVSTPSRRGLPRVPSPVKSASQDPPTSLWSWNTIGNLGELRQNSTAAPTPASENPFGNAMDSLHRDIWAANGNGTGNAGNDFLRVLQNSASNTLNTTLSNSLNNSLNNSLGNSMNSGAPAPSPFLRNPGASSQQFSSQQSQMQQQPSQNTRLQQQQQQQQQQAAQRGYGDLWNGSAMMHQNSSQPEYGSSRLAHSGAGDLANGGGYSPWNNPTQQQQQQQQQQLRGSQQQQNHNTMFHHHSFFDNGM